MRQALTGLSRLLGSEALVISGETVALDPNVVESDVLRFEALIQDGRQDPLREAVGLWRGGIVPIARSAKRLGSSRRRRGSTGSSNPQSKR